MATLRQGTVQLARKFGITEPTTTSSECAGEVQINPPAMGEQYSQNSTRLTRFGSLVYGVACLALGALGTFGVIKYTEMRNTQTPQSLLEDRALRTLKENNLAQRAESEAIRTSANDVVKRAKSMTEKLGQTTKTLEGYAELVDRQNTEIETLRDKANKLENVADGLNAAPQSQTERTMTKREIIERIDYAIRRIDNLQKQTGYKPQN